MCVLKTLKTPSTVLNNENVFTTIFAHIDYGISNVRTDLYRIIALKTLSTVVSIQSTVDFLNLPLNFFVILQFQLTNFKVNKLSY